MVDIRFLLFDTFRLDTQNECVWRGEQALQLTPKTFALLRYLAERPGQLVTKDELLKVVWPEVVVSEGVLTTHIGVIRQALGDKAKVARYIETVHRRGYRFIAPLTTTQPVVSSASSPRSRLAADHQQLTTPLVGREAGLAQLHSWLEKALRGERQVVFVTGEAGIGKTTVVDAFVIQAAADAALWVGHGQCIEQFGPGEAYLPLLAAFGQLCREPGHEQVLSVLEQYAPTWLVQMPALLPPSDFETLQRRVSVHRVNSI
jgi:DNA-binding winged helix-turn-helix (wHTH) protein